MPDELDALLADHEERSRRKQQAAAAREAALEKAKSQCTSVLSHVVLPVARDFKERLERNGHRLEIAERIEGSVHPKIALELTPKSPYGDLEATLTFVCRDGMVVASGEVLGVRASPDFERRTETSATEIDRAWAKAYLLRYVQQTLELL
jgi:hypothetical protein